MMKSTSYSNSTIQIESPQESVEMESRLTLKATLEKRLFVYSTVMYLIGFYSGFMNMFLYPNMNYVQNVLGLSPKHLADFNSALTISWALKPLYSYMSETFFPFRYRIKSYMIGSLFMIATMSFLLCFYTPGFYVFTLQSFIICLGYGMIDSLGEGITALVLKTKKEIQFINSSLKSIELFDNKTEFGNFHSFRTVWKHIFLFSGGFYATSISFHIFSLIQFIITSLIALYVIIGFYEPKVSI